MSQANVLTKYRALFSSSTITPYQSEEIKKINDLGFVDFLFQLMKATKGQNNYSNIILKGVFNEMKSKSDINLQIKKILKEFFACDVNIMIPTNTTTNSVSGINIAISEIDPYGLLQVDPNTSLGKHIYDGNDINKHINFIFYSSLKATADKPLSYKFKGREMLQVYASNSDNIVFKFGSYYNNKPLSEWMIDYLDSNDFFNVPNFTGMLLDLISGSLSIKAGKGKLQIKEDSKLIKALQKIFGFCSENSPNNVTDSSTSTYLNTNQINQSEDKDRNTTKPNDFFDFTNKELEEIDKDANLRSNSSIRFSTCNDLEIHINPNDVITGLDALFGAYTETPTTDLLKLEPKIYDNSAPTLNADKATQLFSNILKPGTQAIISSGETDLGLSYPNIQAELQLGIFKAIPYALIKSIITPKLTILSKITSTVVNIQGGTQVPPIDTKTLITKISPILRVVGLNIIDRITKNIFDQIKKDIIKLTKDLAVKYIKQRGSDYILTLTSLLSLLNKLKKPQKTRCQSVISKLLSLLDLGNFGAMPPIPGPLILIAGQMKPGLNQVSIINSLKSRLQNKGIETAPFFSDGTPNYMMYAMEEMVAVMVEHIKTNAKIDVFAMGATGPITGSAQIQ